MRSITIAAVALLVAGCAHVTPQERLDAAQTVTCSTPDECELKWARATKWIQDNSHWKLQTVTPTMLTTFGPGGEVFPAYNVLKFPIGNSAYELQFKATCNDMGLGCHPPIPRVTASFKNYVQTGVMHAA